MTPLPSVLAAYTVSVTGWCVLAGLAFIAAFGNRISDRTRKGDQ